MKKKDLELALTRSQRANELAKKGFIIHKPLPYSGRKSIDFGPLKDKNYNEDDEKNKK